MSAMTADLFTAAEPVPAKPSDRAVTEDLMARLKRHYIKPGAPLPGGVFVPEVGQNGSWGRGRRCDAIYVGFTGTSGRLLVGHEVKASRADWLTELAQPGKADTWADECHEWWLVTVPGVVHDGELPDGWGLMVPGRSKTRMQVVTPARRKPADHRPSWDAVRSVIARQDTLRQDAIREGIAAGTAKVYEAQEARVQDLVEQRLRARGDVESISAELDRIRRALGVTRVLPSEERAFRDSECTEADLADVAALLRHHGTLAEAAWGLVSRYGEHPFMQLRRAVDAVDRARQAVINSIREGSAHGS
ncbi:hypothetical protein [Xylanimonas oleitrophica]|uniref:hypothetical protein n=1 Tax=Xylanimonas oleitrophica TaxID=2607479 RepID=UPI001C54E6E7|nr:hypothetical protein [Xylanimonas oleitrophica]